MSIRQKAILGFLCVLITVTIGSTQSFASTWCQSATIEKVGLFTWDRTGASSYKIEATCHDVPAVWTGTRAYYIADNEIKKSMYATLLTAMSLDQRVALLVANPSANSLIHMIYLLPTSN